MSTAPTKVSTLKRLSASLFMDLWGQLLSEWWLQSIHKFLSMWLDYNQQLREKQLSGCNCMTRGRIWTPGTLMSLIWASQLPPNLEAHHTIVYSLTLRVKPSSLYLSSWDYITGSGCNSPHEIVALRGHPNDLARPSPHLASPSDLWWQVKFKNRWRA
jgi:hypothetical protein